MLRFRTIAAVLIAVILFACKKDKELSFKNISIELDDEYVDANQVDSAVLFWEMSGTTWTLGFKEFGNTLVADISTLPTGNGLMTIQIYSNTILESEKSIPYESGVAYPLQFENREQRTIGDENIEIRGPISIEHQPWNPRIYMHGYTHGSHYTAIMGLRPEDPYVELRDIPADRKKYIRIGRTFGIDQQAVTFKEWEIAEGHNLIDREYFSSLPQEINGADWNREALFVNYQVTEQAYVGLSFIYRRK